MKSHFQNLEMKDLNFSYGEKSVLQNVNLILPLEKVVWIHGASGSGKSVFAKILSGLLPAATGSFAINGEKVNEMSFEEFLPHRMKIGYSFDYGGLLSNRTIEQNLRLPLEYHRILSPEQIADQVNEVAEIFKLKSVFYERPSTIPGAFRKAACLARAFVMNPEMVVLDDPTSGLRGEIKQNLKRMILNRAQDSNLKHVFIVTEDHHFISDLFDHVFFVQNASISLLSQDEWRQQDAG